MIPNNQMNKRQQTLNNETVLKISQSCLACTTNQILEKKQLLQLVQEKLQENSVQMQSNYSFSGVGLSFVLKKQISQPVDQEVNLINKFFEEIFQLASKIIHQNLRQSPKQLQERVQTKITRDIEVFKSVFVSIVINNQKPFLELLELFMFQEHQKYANQQVQAIKILSDLIFEILNGANDSADKQQNLEQSSSMDDEGESQVETATYGIQTLVENLEQPQSISSLNAPFRIDANRHLEMLNFQLNLPHENNESALWRIHSEALTLDYVDYAFREESTTDVQMIDLTFYETKSTARHISLLESDTQGIS